MFYGWKIVGATFVTLFISVGFVFYSYGVFFTALEAEFGGGRFGISLGLTLMNVATGLMGPFLGRALDRGSIRNIMCYGVLLMTAGFVIASRITALWQFYLLLATCMGIGAAMFGPVAGSTLIANWFMKRRGTALGIATMGVSLSGVIMPMVSTPLIHAIGWRNTFLVYAVVTFFFVLPFAWFFIVSRPEELGTGPDGRPAGPLPAPSSNPGHGPSVPVHSAHELTTRQVLTSGSFWVITIVIGMNFFTNGATLTHLIPHTLDLGYTGRWWIISLSAAPLSVSALTGVLGKVLFGYVSDGIGAKHALWIAMLFQGAGMAVFLMGDAYAVLLVGGALFGFGMGGIVPLQGSLIGEAFGRYGFGRVMGLMMPCMLPIQTLGIPFAGLVHDWTGDYNVAFETFIGVYGVAALVLLLFRRPGLDRTRRKPGSTGL